MDFPDSAAMGSGQGHFGGGPGGFGYFGARSHAA
jgi:hypothetical protein